MELLKYLTVKQFTKFKKIDWMEGVELRVHTIHALTDIPLEEISNWPLTKLNQKYLELSNLITKVNNKFYPIVEIKGQLYGFQPVEKMSVAEYADLENLSYDVEGNIEQILSIVYRPIVKHKLKSLKFVVDSYIKYYKGEDVDIYKYYDVEKYDSQNKPDVSEFPADLAFSIISFFLQEEKRHSLNTLIYSHPLTHSTKMIIQQMKKLKQKLKQSRSIMGGYTHYTNLVSIPSYK